MSLRSISRAKFGGALIGAFLGGLVIASGFDLTPFGYAQPAAQATQVPTRAAAPVAPASVTELNVAFTSIAESVTPAVVSIQAERSARQLQQQQRPQRRNQPPSLEDFFGQFGPQPQQPRQASGSGFIVSKDGYILTNNHVVDDFDRVHVTLTDQRTFDARVIGRDPTTDVAVIKIDAGNNLPVAALGNDESVKIGEWVLAIGNPLGLDFTVTAGIVSAKGRGSSDIGQTPNQNRYQIADFIQTDAAINPGNSGGPLVNIRGEVIGINSMIASQTGYFSGYGFAIPITLAKNVMDDIITHGRVRRAMLGVSITDAQAEDAAAAGLKDITGVLVQDYSPDITDSPAKRAGLEAGDVIVRADGRSTPRVSTLQRIIRAHEPGDVVEIEAMRFGQRKTFRVKLGEVQESATRSVANAPDSNREEGRGTAANRLGITVSPVTAEQAQANEIPDDRRGLRVVDVSDDGPARAKLVQDDVLVGTINPVRTTLRTPQDLQQVVSRIGEGSYISLLVYNVSAKTTRVVSLRVGSQK